MQIKVTGLKEVERELLKLGSKDGTRVLRAAMLRAATPIERAAKANAAALPEGSGALEQAIGKRFSVGKAKTFTGVTLPELGGRFTVEVAPLRKSRVAIALHNLFYGRRRKGIFYGHLLEWGHRIARGGHLRKRDRSGGGKGTEAGFVQPRRIFGPALQAKGAIAVQSLADEIKKGIANLLAKAK